MIYSPTHVVTTGHYRHYRDKLAENLVVVESHSLWYLVIAESSYKCAVEMLLVCI